MPALTDTPQVGSTEFSDTFPYRGMGDVWLNAGSFNRYVEKFLAPIEELHGPTPRVGGGTERQQREAHLVFEIKAHARPIGLDCRFYLRFLPRGEPLEIFDGRRQVGEAHFNGYEPVFILVLDTSWDTWMSITPSEIFSLRPGLDRARGKVLIGGLGMGWFARRILERPGVTSVTVVERSPDLISFFGDPLLREFGDRVRFVEGDAFTAVRHSTYDSVLFDVWPGCGQSLEDDRWLRIARRHRNAWAW